MHKLLLSLTISLQGVVEGFASEIIATGSLLPELSYAEITKFLPEHSSGMLSTLIPDK